MSIINNDYNIENKAKALAYTLHGKSISEDDDIGLSVDVKEGLALVYLIDGCETVVMKYANKFYSFYNDGGFSKKEKTHVLLGGISFNIFWNNEFDYFTIYSKSRYYPFQILDEMYAGVEFEGAVFPIDDLECEKGSDISSNIDTDVLEVHNKVNLLTIGIQKIKLEISKMGLLKQLINKI